MESIAALENAIRNVLAILGLVPASYAEVQIFFCVWFQALHFVYAVTLSREIDGPSGAYSAYYFQMMFC